MKRPLALAAAVLFAAVFIASAQQPIATIHLQRAILSTGEGKRAAARLQAQWDPEMAALAKGQAQIKADR